MCAGCSTYVPPQLGPGVLTATSAARPGRECTLCWLCLHPQLVQASWARSAGFTYLHSWARPRGPGVLTEHLVAVQEGLV
jgi:hypothetical protein